MLIYIVTNKINGKVYVGQTCQSIAARWYLHCKNAKTGSKLPIHCAIRKYGEAGFRIDRVSDASTLDELDSLEVTYIARYNSMVPHGYNRTQGGAGFNGRHTDASRERMRNSHLGKTLSTEQRQKISESGKRLWTDPSFRKNNTGRLGKKASLESRAKTSQSIKNHWKIRKAAQV